MWAWEKQGVGAKTLWRASPFSDLILSHTQCWRAPEFGSLPISICTHNLEHLTPSYGLKYQEADTKMGLDVQEIYMLWSIKKAGVGWERLQIMMTPLWKQRRKEGGLGRKSLKLQLSSKKIWPGWWGVLDFPIRVSPCPTGMGLP